MMVDLLESSSRPLGTGMSSNSLRWGRLGDDAQAERTRAIMNAAAIRRIRGTSWRPCYCRLGLGAKLLTALAIVVAFARCAGAQVPPIGAEGAAFAPEPDERQLWTAAGRESEAIARAG